PGEADRRPAGRAGRRAGVAGPGRGGGREVSDMGLSLLAVHLSDGAIATPWLVGGFVGAAALLGLAAWRLSDDWVPRIGVLTAAFFIGSTIHIKLAVVPTSVHLVLNGLVGVVLGRRAPLAVTVGL